MAIYQIENMGEELIKDMEHLQNTSLRRIMKMNIQPIHVEKFISAAHKLKSDNKLTVAKTNTKLGIPCSLPNYENFKYAPQLLFCRGRIFNGEKLTIVFIYNAAHETVAFAIINNSATKSEIEIIDTDKRFRRESPMGYKLKISFDDVNFEVGLGHVIVASVADLIEGTIEVDAANDRSAYIFRSLGYQGSQDCKLCLRGSEESEEN